MSVATDGGNSHQITVDPLTLIKWAINQGVAVAIAGFVLYKLADVIQTMILQQQGVINAVQRNSELIAQYCK